MFFIKKIVIRTLNLYAVNVAVTIGTTMLAISIASHIIYYI